MSLALAACLAVLRQAKTGLQGECLRELYGSAAFASRLGRCLSSVKVKVTAAGQQQVKVNVNACRHTTQLQNVGARSPARCGGANTQHSFAQFAHKISVLHAKTRSCSVRHPNLF